MRLTINDRIVESKDRSVIEKKWLQLRQSLLKNIKAQVRLYLGPESEDLALYAQAYKNDIERAFQCTTFEAMIRTLAQCDVILGGDFHAFPQAQRSHLRVLRALAPQRKLLLALEIFRPQDQLSLDRYLAGQINEEELRIQSQWNDFWGFPWRSYVPLLKFAKRVGLPVVGINQVSRLGEGESMNSRDDFASLKILEAKAGLEKSQESLLSSSLSPSLGSEVAAVYVLFGDLHIAKPHLERALEQNSSGPLNIGKVFLNPEKAYFELAREKKETSVNVLSFAPSEFAVIGSPPWVKWQSYLMFLEESFDYDLDFDHDEEWGASNSDDGDIMDGDWDDDWDENALDDTDHVIKFVRLISAALGVTISENHLEVYSSLSADVLDRTMGHATTEEWADIANFLVASDRSFYLPGENFFYLSKRTANHVGSLAAQYVHSQLTQRSRLLWTFPDDFCGLIWVEAMGFFLSKFVNPKRKAPSIEDLRRQLSVFHPTDEGREPLLLALDQRMRELRQLFTGGGSSSPAFLPRQKASYIEAGRFLGSGLGERYFHLFERGKITRDQVLERVQRDPSDGDFKAFYFKELGFLDRIEKA